MNFVKYLAFIIPFLFLLILPAIFFWGRRKERIRKFSDNQIGKDKWNIGRPKPLDTFDPVVSNGSSISTVKNNRNRHRDVKSVFEGVEYRGEDTGTNSAKTSYIQEKKSLKGLQEAIVWSEILGPPRGLDGWES